ncbi:hypothetical protein K435DRAFT_799791 [Dendrothele bispora CBS 962.96]|uniref:Uncharacterized protein n=1 Tax=Dendrothele bispora (strain CBS 962.96) TaxID=1314807 RepID=A0A4S8LUR3_DENBC|nr:hypothetical protein K435DRAFT_799791 [Dendrothele bispora CBS 962.96]
MVTMKETREKKKENEKGNKSEINLTELQTPAGVKYSLLSIGDASVASRHTQKNLQKKCKLAVLGETLNTRREGGSRPIRGDKENESEIHGKAYAKTKREKEKKKDEIYNILKIQPGVNRLDLAKIGLRDTNTFLTFISQMLMSHIIVQMGYTSIGNAGFYNGN